MIPQSEFHAILKAVSSCAQKKYDGRPQLMSVRFEFLEDSMNIVSVSGHRVAIAKLNINKGTGNFLISLADIDEILGIFKYKSDKRILFNAIDNVLTINNGKITLKINQLDEQFPDYQQVLPKNDDAFEEVMRFDSRYISQIISSCKDLCYDSNGIDIILKDTSMPSIFRPILKESLETIESLNYFIMPMRKT